MTCEHCGAPLRADIERGLFLCDYCGSEMLPPQEDDGVLVLDETRFICPVCGKKLNHGSLEQFGVLHCRGCGGMLIAMDDLEPLVSALRAHRGRPSEYLTPRNAADAERSLVCPRCGGAMEGHPYGGGGNVNVDSCERCESVWMDKGELRKIAAAPDYEPLYLDHGDDRGQ